jgi:glutathione S-transferase
MKLFVDSLFLSPYALSAFVALHEKQLDFEFRTVDLAAGGQNEPGFARLSLTRRVPLLVDGELRLNESSAIAEYLDDAYGGPRLYPADVRQRARAREVQAWLRSDLAALRSERSTEVVFKGKLCPPMSDAARAAADRLVEAADQLIPEGGEHLFAHWCIADTDLALMLKRLQAPGDGLPDKLAAYVRRQWSRPALGLWLAQTGA